MRNESGVETPCMDVIYHSVSISGEPDQLILLPRNAAGTMTRIGYCDKHRMEFVAEPRTLEADCPRCYLEALEYVDACDRNAAAVVPPISLEEMGNALRGIVIGLIALAALFITAGAVMVTIPRLVAVALRLMGSIGP